MRTENAIFAGIFSILGVLVVWLLFVMAPVAMYADMKCAEAGYPKSKITINLKSYCMTLDGAVTVKMEQLK